MSLRNFVAAAVDDCFILYEYFPAAACDGMGKTVVGAVFDHPLDIGHIYK